MGERLTENMDRRKLMASFLSLAEAAIRRGGRLSTTDTLRMAEDGLKLLVHHIEERDELKKNSIIQTKPERKKRT